MTGGSELLTHLAIGMPALAIPRPNTGVATVAIAASTGSRSEPFECSGYAHMVEHLMCSDIDYSRGVQNLGGTFNASTRADRTVYLATVPAESLAQLLSLEAQRFSTMSFTPEAVLRESEVIAAEVHARFHRHQHPQFPMPELRSIMFRDDRNRIDRADAVVPDPTEATEALNTYFTWTYAPPQLALVIVGDVDPGHALDLAADSWSGVPYRQGKRFSAPSELGRGPTPADYWDVSDRAAVAIGFRTTEPKKLPDYLATVALAEYLSEFALQYQADHIATTAFNVDLAGDPLDVVGPTGLVARAIVKPGTEPGDALEELENFVSTAFSAVGTEKESDTFSTAKIQLSTRLRTGLDDTATEAAFAASRLCGSGKYDLPEVMKYIAGMEQAEVARAGTSLGRPYRVGLRRASDRGK